jgi:predicted HNH restriction endonuclease
MTLLPAIAIIWLYWSILKRGMRVQKPARKRQSSGDWWKRYNAYLASEAWQQKRDEAFAHYGRKCSQCSATRRLQVHHKRYPKVFGTEPVSDLLIVCIPCHERIHGRKIGR